MGRRSDIDWAAIERDYRAGAMSAREIAAKHEVSASAVVRKAEKLGWTQDLTAQVRLRTSTKLALAGKATKQQAVANQVPLQPAPPLSPVEAEQAIEEAAATNVQVVLNHRQDIARIRALAAGMLDELTAEAAKPANNVRLELAKRAAVLKQLTDTVRVQVALERQAFNIVDNGVSVADPLAQLIADVQKARAGLPIVELDAG